MSSPTPAPLLRQSSDIPERTSTSVVLGLAAVLTSLRPARAARGRKAKA
ncbi:hypothetical protein ACTMSW_19550 [Micromonospora sp. BQ11]